MPDLPLVSSLTLTRIGRLERDLDRVALWSQWTREGPAVLLESGGGLEEPGRWVILAGAPEALFFEKDGIPWLEQAGKSGPFSGSFDDWCDRVAPSEAPLTPMPQCLSRAWFGALSYEFLGEGPSNGHRNGRSRTVPRFFFLKPTRVIAIDRSTREFQLWGREPFDPFQGSAPRVPFRAWDLQRSLTPAEYAEKVRKVQAYIAQGDIYQANIAQSFSAQWEGTPESLYRLLREMNPGPFMGLLGAPGFTLVSSSPERLVSERGEFLETRPIAGTRPRGKDPTQDLQLQMELRCDPKELAEHLMLVDLARNDLGRVSRYGSVEVPRFAAVEAYAKVQHLVSTVRSRKDPGVPVSRVIRSLFPGGTITGCPKKRCMEIIREIEGQPRGFYTGSLGYLAPGPQMDLNILIRTFTLFPDGSLEFHAGAGIVADSHPAREYQETLDKVEALFQSLGVPG